MSYFDRFPSMVYDMKNDGNFKLLPDILRRVKQRNAIKDGQFIFDTYDVRDGEKPEDVAYKWFGDAQLHWVILMTNNVTDRYFDWPMNQPQFAEFLTDKYGTDVDSVHHYEVTRDSGRTTGQGPNDYSYLVAQNHTYISLKFLFLSFLPYHLDISILTIFYSVKFSLLLG